MAQYFCLGFWLIWPTVRGEREGGKRGRRERGEREGGEGERGGRGRERERHLTVVQVIHFEAKQPNNYFPTSSKVSQQEKR